MKDNNSFWKSWNNKINNNKFIDTPVSVNGWSKTGDIANEFKDYFANIYLNSSDDIEAVNEFVNLDNLSLNSSSFGIMLSLDVEIIEQESPA